MAARAGICLLSLIGANGFRHRRSTPLPQLPTRALADGESGWWVHDGEMAYFPPAALAGLSENISDYYYALGSTKALSKELKQRRVGGKESEHIFYLPEGTAPFKRDPEEASPTRAFSLGELQSLQAGESMAKWRDFPRWKLPANYQDPLNSAGLAVEQEVMSQITPDKYGDILKELSDPNSPGLQVNTRTTNDKEATAKVVSYLESQFMESGMTTCLQSHQAGGWFSKKNVTNVIGFVKGTEKGSVILGAHFDDLPSTGIAPGAVDNGSGVAAVLISLKAFMLAGVKPKKSVYFVAFGGEEQGLYGSKRFAKELKRPDSTDSPIPEACRVGKSSDHSALTIDMIGWRSPRFSEDTVLVETKNRWSKQLIDPMARANNLLNDGRVVMLYNDQPYGSDHDSFLTEGFPATMAIDNDGDAVKYPCYHKSCDTIDKVSLPLGTEITKMQLGALLRIAGIN